MNIKSYISSGILEAYVLGELSEIEKETVEKNAYEFPEIYKEICHIRKAFNEIAIQSRMHAGLVSKVESFYNNNEIKRQVLPPKVFFKNSILKRPNISVFAYIAGVAAIIALIASFVAIDFYLKWRNSQNVIEQLRSEKELLLESAHGSDEGLKEALKSSYPSNSASAEKGYGFSIFEIQPSGIHGWDNINYLRKNDLKRGVFSLLNAGDLLEEASL